jgi:hypothetical protein
LRFFATILLIFAFNFRIFSQLPGTLSTVIQATTSPANNFDYKILAGYVNDPHGDPSYINIGGVNAGGYGGNITLQTGNGMNSSGSINLLIPGGSIKIGTNISTIPMTISNSGNLVTTGTITGSIVYANRLSSNIATGTAPFLITSTTLVPNLNADMVDGFHAPASGIVGLTETQTLSNKTIGSASVRSPGYFSTLNATTATISGGSITGTPIGTTSSRSAGYFSTLDATSATISTLTINGGTINTPTISGGTINGTTIGATTPSAGSFTSLTTSGNANICTGYASVNIGSAPGESTGWGSGYVGFNMNRNNSAWNMITDNNHNGGALILASILGSLRFVTMQTQTYGTSNRTIDDATMISNTRMLIRTDGNIGIGCDGRAEYKLAVNGPMIATKVVVKNYTYWPDYVFSANHKIPTLAETEAYIKANNHLEGVPTESDVKENGVDVAEMNIILLKKVEELTLIIIEQNNRLNKQEKDINDMKEYSKK